MSILVIEDSLLAGNGLTLAKLKRAAAILDANDAKFFMCYDLAARPGGWVRQEFMGYTFFTPPARSPESKTALITQLERDRRAREGTA